MRFSLSSEHNNFFSKQGYIAFENLLIPAQREQVSQEIQTILKKRCRKEQTPALLFDKGFDLFRDSPFLQKFTDKVALTRIAAELFQVPLLRMGFDQYFPDPSFFKEGSLEENCSAKPLAGGLLIPLEGSSEIFFIAPRFRVNWKEVFQQGSYYLIAYGVKHTLYHLEPKDPHTHAWKKLGYVFGDTLVDEFHPVCH